MLDPEDHFGPEESDSDESPLDARVAHAWATAKSRAAANGPSSSSSSAGDLGAESAGRKGGMPGVSRNKPSHISEAASRLLHKADELLDLDSDEISDDDGYSDDDDVAQQLWRSGVLGGGGGGGSGLDGAGYGARGLDMVDMMESMLGGGMPMPGGAGGARGQRYADVGGLGSGASSSSARATRTRRR